MAKPIPTVDEIRAKVCAAAFGNPLIENSFRGFVAEMIIGSALGSEWRLCSADWSGWDFEHTSGCRLEVKQSAARQTWAAPKKPSAPNFVIRERKGYYEGAKFVEQAGRLAHIYVFAYHPIRDDSADHRDPNQWRFHVVPATRLPPNKTIGLVRVALLCDAVPWIGLSEAVESACAAL
jgi:hypothetical protein